MKKVLVIGSSGAGKSTFARRLHKATGLELVHLDKLYWKPNWVETTDKNEWRKTLAEVLKGDKWIIDGNYGSTMEMRIEASDTVILLDMPRTVCVYRILKRMAFYRKGERLDMAEGCDEKFDWEFIKWTWNYPKQSKPKVEELLKRFENEKTIIRLKSKKEIENFFAKYSNTSVIK
ncbi:MAG: DNA topology modulation protein [Acidobacteria bacterium]|jgi:adenylate kinase family enzyme|nr:DNA topology modulation protein [Acidobacteriota bacterium]